MMAEENYIPEGDKKLIQRSASYPNITIEEAIEIVSQIKKSFPTSQFDRDDVTAVLKRTNIARDIGAAVQYGLLLRTKGQGYKLSPVVQAILNYVTDEERKLAIIECFKTPKLYLELIERFKGHAIPPDHQFKAILIRYHNITEAAAPQAVEIFLQNAAFAGVINESKILFFEGVEDFGNKEVKQEDKSTLSNIDLAPSANEVRQSNLPQTPLLLEQMNGEVDLIIYLSEKKRARLIYPDKLNEKDIQILKLQLEQIALTL